MDRSTESIIAKAAQIFLYGTFESMLAPQDESATRNKIKNVVEENLPERNRLAALSDEEARIEMFREKINQLEGWKDQLQSQRAVFAANFYTLAFLADEWEVPASFEELANIPFEVLKRKCSSVFPIMREAERGLLELEKPMDVAQWREHKVGMWRAAQYCAQNSALGLGRSPLDTTSLRTSIEKLAP